ncbi:taurine ABC transporter substrate-binding protein [Zavarzinia sp. CC-PAN008]|uniref:taurine ABC transporter substrate-binding protein n=1 Tax=Zavarzinia sp. CC-PAN008 TaxID=3243332 RepID=UPI003F748757
MHKLIAAAALLAASALGAPAQAADQKVVVAYQTDPTPFVRAVASGELEKATGWQIEFRRFNSGAEIFAAIASGDVQIGDVGSSPYAAATSKGIDVRAFYISAGAGDSEALVVRDGSGIETLADLKGKRLAAAPVSTDHYMLLSTLKQEGIAANEAEVFAIPQPEIVAAWSRGDLDGAFVWEPALGKLKENGKVLLTAGQAAERGAATFTALVATGAFAEANPEFLQAFTATVDGFYRDYAAHPEAWNATSENARVLADFTGAKQEDVPARLAGSIYLPAAVQASPAWLGGAKDSGVAKVLSNTAQFLLEQQKITAVADDYSPFVDPRFVVALPATN